MFIELSLKEFNKALGSKSATPGGGSVAALSGALGAELVCMVCNISIGKQGLECYEQDLRHALKLESDLADQLMRCVDTDTEAFNKVLDAFQLPKRDDKERASRNQAIQQGYKEAIASPLGVGCLCMKSLEEMVQLQGKANKNAISDLGVAAMMAYAGIEGAVMNVYINLSSVKDQRYRAVISNQTSELLERGRQLKEIITHHVSGVISAS